jgi:hypothetical protein
MLNYLWGGAMIDEIIHLLGERNRYLSQFCILNNVQIGRLNNDNYDQLSEFYLMREQILAVVEKIELLIEQKSTIIDPAIANEKREKIENLLSQKDQIIRDILKQDLEILSSIEKQKTHIITELKSLQKGKKVLTAYKSGIKNNKIDEEA